MVTPPLPPPASPRVLLVEDDQDTLELYTTVFGFSGMDVLEARNGRQALELATRECPDAVVTDLAMPAMDGLELCRQLRRGETTRQVVVIIVTGQGLDSDQVVADSAGADLVLQKPCLPQTLVEAVRQLLMTARETCELSRQAREAAETAREAARALRREARRLRQQQSAGRGRTDAAGTEDVHPAGHDGESEE